MTIYNAFRRISIVFYLAVGVVNGSHAQDVEAVVIIVNKANTLATLSAASIANIYQGREEYWPDGQKIHIINRPIDSEIRAIFYQQVLNARPTAQYLKKGSPLPMRTMTVESDIATKKFVARLPNAISYIRKSALDNSVKAVYTIPVQAGGE